MVAGLADRILAARFDLAESAVGSVKGFTGALGNIGGSGAVLILERQKSLVAREWDKFWLKGCRIRSVLANRSRSQGRWRVIGGGGVR